MGWRIGRRHASGLLSKMDNGLVLPVSVGLVPISGKARPATDPGPSWERLFGGRPDELAP
ncbi:hypothetical protein [Kibdelosporangium philippinense]|uniref:hypothetical protein n=1 Tax=Kibdelosporangium philippinense TaxID=211113 RepID=UPI00361A0ED9